MKVIAFYLPQFHQIPENDEWWGEGFTEWVNMKKARPIFEGQYQPRKPLNNNYYDLSNKDVMRWQTSLAKKYGVYGFCFYHYWFDGHLLLEKPLENFLNDKDNNFPFCICWANENWTQAWVSKEDKILISQNYGNEKEWERHFYYLLPFFKDNRYIKTNNKPFLVIYKPDLIPCLNKMLDCLNKLAIKNGFEGIDFAYQHINYALKTNKDDSKFAYSIEYQPSYAVYDMTKNNYVFLRWIKRKLIPIFDMFKINITQIRMPGLIIRDYDEVWKYILARKPVDNRSIPGAFVDWDNTPRRQEKGWVIKGGNPTKFEEYMTKQIKRAREQYKKEYIFLFAWNEWAEGGYMEPDEKYKYGMLEALKNALLENDEFPQYPL